MVISYRVLSTWQPIPGIPINVPVNPDARTPILALLLAVFSGFLFALVPVRQVLRTDPWQIIRSGSTGYHGSLRHGYALRDDAARLQSPSALCTSCSFTLPLRVRGLARSLHSDYGFQPQNAILVQTDLHMAGC